MKKLLAVCAIALMLGGCATREMSVYEAPRDCFTIVTYNAGLNRMNEKTYGPFCGGDAKAVSDYLEKYS